MQREIILGPPGTGKTTRLLNIVDEAIASGISPDKIGFFSFTKKAAGEAVDRACKKFNLEKKDLPYFRTLHSMCFHSLGLSNSDVFEGNKMMEFGDWLGVKLTQSLKMDDSALFGFSEGDRALHMENMARVMCVPLRQLYDHYHDGLPWTFVDRVSRGLEKFKRAKGLLDYTDMLDMFSKGDWAPTLDLLIVDEAQDLSQLQWRAVDRLASRSLRTVVAGDDDQAIYRWAGAAVEYFVDMRGDVTVLGQSWRVPPEIQSISNELISKVKHRRDKQWRAKDGIGTVERVSSVYDMDFSGQDVLVLARNAFSLRTLATHLRREGHQFELRSNPSIKASVIGAVRRWEDLRRGKQISIEDARFLYEQMSSGKGVRRGYKKIPGQPDDLMVDLAWLRAKAGLLTEKPWFEALDRIPREELNYIRAVIQRGETLGKSNIRLSTIHGSKGGEADHVILIPDMARRSHQEMQTNPEDEARVWYVGVTRTRSRLTLIKPSDALHYVL